MTLAAAVVPVLLTAQTPGPQARALQSWISLPINPGFEKIATEAIMEVTTGFTRDPLGNLVKSSGSGSPHRVIACGIDQVGYAVSEITDDGYLRVHGAGSGRRAPLWDQFNEGQRVMVAVHPAGALSQVSYVPGVFAVRSTHLWRGRSAGSQPPSVEDLWLDVGARSRAEVSALGIQMLDPVVREWPAWSYGEYVAGPGAADRAGCAAVASAASAPAPSSGRTTYIISAQSTFGYTGLIAALTKLGRVDSVVILGASTGRTPATPFTQVAIRAPWRDLAGVNVDAVTTIPLPALYPGTLVESVSERDLARFSSAVARAAGLRATLAPVTLAAALVAPPASSVRDSLSRWGNLLGDMTDVYSVSGHEAPMRAAVRAALPAWARERLVTDTAGNLILAMGPDRDTALFVAHMDEIGFEVASIAHDGTVTMRTRGGFLPSIFEGQTALIHRPDDKIPTRDAQLGCGASRGGPVRGVFVPRENISDGQPWRFTAWFGVDSATLVAQGVTVGLPVTSYKCSARVGATRFTARAIDDRAGSTALITALDDIDPAKLDHKVIFAWVVREEIGLEGAHAVGEKMRSSVRRVYAVDTFVSSDSPLESHRFAFTPIGAGAVLRGLDNSSATPPDETARVVRIAAAAGIPLQIGTTNGGNDGSAVARYGVVDVPIAWPLRYSHSPAELIDLRDVRSLARLIAEVAKEN